MDRFDRDLMNFRLRLSQQREGAQGQFFHRLGKLRVSDQMTDGRKGEHLVVMAVMRMGMRVPVLMRMIVMLMLMVMRVRMTVSMRNFGGLSLHQDVDLYRVDAAAIHFLDLQCSPEVQLSQCGFEQIDRHACLHKSAEEHVAADSGKGIKISESHERKGFRGKAPRSWSQSGSRRNRA